MSEILEGPDAEALAVTFLKSHTAGIKCGTKYPATIPVEFVRISRTGGVGRDFLTDSPILLFECTAVDSVAASRLALRQHAIALAAGRLSDSVTRSVEVAGVAFFPDPDTNRARYQFTVQWDIRRTAI